MAISLSLRSLDRCFTNLVPNYDGVRSGKPARAQHVYITGTHAAVGNLDVDIGLARLSVHWSLCRLSLYAHLFPGLWLELLPLHVALDTLLIVALPAMELVVGSSHCGTGCGVGCYGVG